MSKSEDELQRFLGVVRKSGIAILRDSSVPPPIQAGVRQLVYQSMNLEIELVVSGKARTEVENRRQVKDAS